MTGVAFLVGAACSALAGYIGMFIAVRSNLRTAAAAQKSLKDAITVALRGGAVSGFLVVALSLLGVSGSSSPTAVCSAIRRDRAVPHRRLRLRRQLRGAVRAARRRYLHQGGRRRRGPRRQGGGGHPGGRPP